MAENEELNVEKSAEEKQDIEKNKVMGILAYIGILVLVPLLAAKESPFARFHTNQGLVLFIVEIGVYIICHILLFIPIIGWLLLILTPLVYLGLLVLAIIGIVNVCKEEKKELPILGKYKILK